jgi:hypothetical protein
MINNYKPLNWKTYVIILTKVIRLQAISRSYCRPRNCLLLVDCSFRVPPPPDVARARTSGFAVEFAGNLANPAKTPHYLPAQAPENRETPDSLSTSIESVTNISIGVLIEFYSPFWRYSMSFLPDTPIIKNFYGRVIKTDGSSFQCLFSGQGIQGARVTIVWHDNSQRMTAITDSEGKYSITFNHDEHIHYPYLGGASPIPSFSGIHVYVEINSKTVRKCSYKFNYLQWLALVQHKKNVFLDTFCVSCI